MKVAVMYDGKIDVELDAKIRKVMESIDMKWYAQGKNTFNGFRDIAFLYKEEL